MQEALSAQQVKHESCERESEREQQALQEQVELSSLLLQQSKQHCALLEVDIGQLREERRDGLNRLANANSDLTRHSKHTAQVCAVMQPLVGLIQFVGRTQHVQYSDGAGVLSWNAEICSS